MPATKEAPHGLWRSPLTSDALAEQHVTLSNTIVDKTTGAVYWSESRPSEGGREVVVSADGREMTPSGSSTKTKAHGYGGAAAAAGHGRLFLSDMASNSVLQVCADGSEEPKRVVPDNPAMRYGDFDVHPKQANFVLAVRQDETSDNPAEQPDALVLIDADTATVTPLVEGNDFYLAPRWSSSGGQICWLEWSHPNMIFEGSELWVADISSDGQLGQKRHIAGVEGKESISQPRWTPDGSTLLFLSDATGYYNLHAWTAEQGVRLVLQLDMDCGDIDWWFGQSSYTALGVDTVLLPTGNSQLSLVSISSGSSKILDLPVDASYSHVHAISPRQVVAIAHPVSEPPSVVTFDPTASKVSFKTLKSSAKVALASGYLSIPRQISFPTAQGDAYAWLYMPANCDFHGPTTEKPPLVIRIHGGPTFYSSPTLDLRWQYWTSRGFALVDVNHGGSAGFRRAYRERLQGQWGILEVDDAVACARHLAAQIDIKRVIITGQSAGGYTTLQAAVRYPDFFAAGISLYGLGDLAAFNRLTHKLEMYYLNGIIGGSPEEVPEIWRERSPLFHVKQIKTPMLLLQGADDIVVDKSQAEEMAEAMRSVGTRCELKIYEGEGHGWTKSSTIKDSAERSLAFALDVLDIKEASV